MTQIEIRPTLETDIPNLEAINHSNETNYVWQINRLIEGGQITLSFREVKLPRSVRIDYPRKPELVLEETRNQIVLLTALSNNNPVGYIRIAFGLIPNIPLITDLAVSFMERRQGIASTLILSAEEWLMKRDYQRIIIETYSKNYPAIAMVQKIGFEFSGYSDYYYANRDIALFFAKSI